MIGNGEDRLLWKDIWLENGMCLMTKFLRGFALDTNKDYKVCHRWALVDGSLGKVHGIGMCSL